MKINRIYLSWRKEKGSRRNLVGVLKRTANEGITFEYTKIGVEKAQKDGFNGYPGIPLDISKKYKENSLDIFSLRLLPLDRADSKKHLSFWHAEKEEDKFNILALTQGLSASDNFEFLGLYHPEKGFRFVTDIAGLSHLEEPLTKDSIHVGDPITYEIERSEHAYKGLAVKLYKGNLQLGYVKNIHNAIFINSKYKLDIQVCAIDQNGTIRQIFVQVSCK